MLTERRLQPRIEVEGPVTLEIAGRTVQGKLQNINISGVQVEVTADVMDLMGSQRSPEGSWPTVNLKFGMSLRGNEFLPAGIGCDLVTTRRLNQKQYVAGLRFVTPDLASREQTIALVRHVASGN